MRFWVSWIQQTCDHRPLTYPPNDGILGWWCSGYDASGDAVLCAVIEAEDADAVRSVVVRDWPEASVWRCFEPRDCDWKPNDRFPLADWMRLRFTSTDHAP